MNETLKAIVHILDDGSPELKIAAAQVVGELQPKAAEVVVALERHLDYADNALNRYLLQALSRIGSEPAVGVLVARLREGGAAADLICHLLGEAGPSVAKVLAKSFATEAPEMQSRVLNILGHYDSPEALGVLQTALLLPQAELSSKAAEHLSERLQEVSEARRKSCKESLSDALAKQPEDLAPASLAHALRVLALMDGTGSRATLLKFAAAKHPPIVRQAALESLQGVKLTPAQAESLLEFVQDTDVEQVGRPSMQALQGAYSWPAKAVPELRKLVSSRKEELKIFGLTALQETPGEELAQLYMTHLHAGNEKQRQVAQIALAKNAKAMAVLFKSLQNERNAEKAARLLEPLKAKAEEFKAAQVKVLCEKAGRLLANGDALGEVHLELALHVSPDITCQELVGKATRLRRARKLAEALTIFLHLAKAEKLDLEGHYQMALARLLMDHEEGRSGLTSHTGDATMGYVAMLVREDFPVFDRLKKESMLEPEDLLRVGRHFNESIGPERRFGTDLLRHLAEKHAKLQAGEEARMMIRSEGI